VGAGEPLGASVFQQEFVEPTCRGRERKPARGGFGRGALRDREAAHVQVPEVAHFSQRPDVVVGEAGDCACEGVTSAAGDHPDLSRVPSERVGD
jgi:hypothetical protein